MLVKESRINLDEIETLNGKGIIPYAPNHSGVSVYSTKGNDIPKHKMETFKSRVCGFKYDKSVLESGISLSIYQKLK